MSREKKIGLTIIGVLTVVCLGVVIARLGGSKEAAQAVADDIDPQKTDGQAIPSSARPTVVETTEEPSVTPVGGWQPTTQAAIGDRGGMTSDGPPSLFPTPAVNTYAADSPAPFPPGEAPPAVTDSYTAASDASAGADTNLIPRTSSYPPTTAAESGSSPVQLASVPNANVAPSPYPEPIDLPAVSAYQGDGHAYSQPNTPLAAPSPLGLAPGSAYGAAEPPAVLPQPSTLVTPPSGYAYSASAPSVAADPRGEPTRYSTGTAYSPAGGSTYGALGTRASDGTYTVQPNDSFWTISARLYGTGAYYQALAEHNRTAISSPNELQVGDRISAPAEAELVRKYRALCPKPSHRMAAQRRMTMVSTPVGGRVYEVQEGDSLYEIARHELGKPTRWAEIYNLNRQALGNDFNYLTPGMRLLLPADAPTDVITRRPGTTLHR